VTLTELWIRLVGASLELAWVSALFLIASFVLRGEAAVDWFQKSWSEARLNLFYYFWDATFIVPIGALLIAGINNAVATGGVSLFSPAAYEGWGTPATLLLCIAVSDFTGYWRHRMLHSTALWPAHAIHHSDTQMTWTTLARFHPLNRFITIGVDALVLSMLGIPPVLIALNGLFRHFYGYFIHGNFGWTYGPLRHVIVSPAMHRWHHVREAQGSGANFATVFALYDRAFGTFYLPRRQIPPLGVTEPAFPTTWLGQVIYPFKVWANWLIARQG
jgi:sterol desaturase/sphingolipid hydroxylase (fatty acid hydroxylase superfamily)